ncbi:MAG: ADP-ribosylglycohydrolase family protein [Lentisphaerae bacterium]|jgi:ADP-ribosylglycohydrolase|nr:ADP-ribosylglycohydrolase family protein [Lentisphaerota bacterium]
MKKTKSGCETCTWDDTAAWLNRHTYLSGVDLELEVLQAEQEGRDLASVRAQIRALNRVAAPDNGNPLGGGRNGQWLERYKKLSTSIQELPLRSGYPYNEPNDLAEIVAARGEPEVEVPQWSGTKAKLRRQIHGALLGRVCGCLLGKPVEGWHRTSIEITAKATGNWPLERYFRVPTKKMAERIAALRPVHKFGATVKERWYNSCLMPHINGMVPDDDTNYTVLGMDLLMRCGGEFTAQDMASAWLQELPLFTTFTAERVAYRNLVAGVVPPYSATLINPYREWIGAQIRADAYGYANPGNPQRAAEWAWRDATISHVKNGIYGAMWVAAMLAAAAVLRDWEEVIYAGLGEIPAGSRLREDVETIVALWDDGADFDLACEYIHALWNERRMHDWCHTNSNAQIVAASLLWGGRDFGKCIGQAVMAGFDTDCNGATVGSLWGMMYGAGRIPKEWSEPVNNILRTSLVNYPEIAIDKFAARFADWARGDK